MVYGTKMEIPSSKNVVPNNNNYDKYAKQRRPNDGAEQFVRFVRDFQTLPRETTELSMSKHKNPLPDIGQKPPVSVHVPSGIPDRNIRGSISDDDSCSSGNSSPRERTWSLTKSSQKPGINNVQSISPIRRSLNKSPVSFSKEPLQRTRSSLDSARRSLVSSLSAYPTLNLSPTGVKNSKQKLGRTKSEPTRRRVTADVRHLPPLRQDNMDILDVASRPSAPSPTYTPHVEDFDDMYLSQYPQDYIDT